MHNKMRSSKQKGSAALTAIALVAAVAAGGYAWLQTNELSKAKRDLAATTSVLEQTKAELAAAKKESTALRAALTSQKEETEKLRGEVSTARSFLEAEKAHSMRLRAELQAAKEQLVLATRYRGQQVPPGMVAVPLTVQRPTAIRIVPGAIGKQAPQAAPAPMPAR